MAERPAFIRHWRALLGNDDLSDPGSRERRSVGANVGKTFGLKRVGFNDEVLPPGRRTSWPHAEGDEEEFVFVIEGTPHVWIDGALYRLTEDNAVGFPAGTGIAHTFINNAQQDVCLLVGGERNRPDSACHYPLHSRRNAEIGERHWNDAPTALKGDHDGLPDALHANPVDPD